MCTTILHRHLRVGSRVLIRVWLYSLETSHIPVEVDQLLSPHLWLLQATSLYIYRHMQLGFSMICLVYLINGAFCVYIYILTRKAPNMVKDLLVEKVGFTRQISLQGNCMGYCLGFFKISYLCSSAWWLIQQAGGVQYQLKAVFLFLLLFFIQFLHGAFFC